ncbi:hypothetical protein Tco_0808850 [Tanacetum coccineum]
MDFDFGLWDEDEEEGESELIYPYEVEGSPYPPPPVSPDSEHEMDILEDVEIRYTLLRMDKERAEREPRHLRALRYGLYEEAVRARAVDVRPGEAIDVLAVYGESQPPGPQGPPSGSQ